MSLLLTLLALAYVGSMLMRGRGLSGYGLPSGSEWLLLGLILGPLGLRVVDGDDLRAFDPIAAVGLSWVALVIGAALAGERTAGQRAATVAGIALALASALVIAAGVYLVAGAFPALQGTDRWILAAGAGLASCETTHHAVAWVATRHAAQGPLAKFLSRMASVDDVVPLVLLGVPFAMQPAPPWQLPVWLWSASPLVLGLVLGVTSASLLSFEKHPERAWGVILGAALLCAGIAWRVGISPLGATLALGVSAVGFSRHAQGLRQMLARTEHAVLLPSLVLAGASLRIVPSALLIASLAVACVGRVALHLLAAPLVARAAGVVARPGARLGLGLLPTGSVTILVGLSYALRFPDGAGPMVLAIALVQTLLGEALGPAALRAALQQAGEILEAPAAADSAAADPGAAQETP